MGIFAAFILIAIGVIMSPVPVIVGGLGASAGRAAAAAIAGVATQAALDGALNLAISVLDGSGEIADTPQTPTISVDPIITINNNPTGTNVEQQIDIGPVGGPPDISLGVSPEAELTAEQIGAAQDDLRSIESQDNGKIALRAIPAAASDNPSAAQNDSAVESSRPEQQQAVGRMRAGKNKINVGKQVALALRLSRKQDRARTSLEYDEWKFNNVDTGKNYNLLKSLVAGKNLLYDGSGPVSPNSSCPWWKWIEYPDFRECINIVKRYRRLRGACGGKALWTEQGFANKEQAIADDVTNDSEYLALRSTLIATADWTETPI